MQESGEFATSGYVDIKSINDGHRAVFKTAVPYPQSAQDHEIEGDVEVAFIVPPQGIVEDVSILEMLNSVFVSTFQRIVKSWRFKPAIVGGVPVRDFSLWNTPLD